MIIEARVELTPVAWPRATPVVRYKGNPYVKENHYATLIVPTSEPFEKYKAAIALAVKPTTDVALLTTPVYLIMDFVFERPQSLTWKRKPMPRAPMRDTPDLDNLEKTVLDAITKHPEGNKVLLRDDRQVCGCLKAKWYGAGGETPHVAVKICTTIDDFVFAIPEWTKQLQEAQNVAPSSIDDQQLPTDRDPVDEAGR